MASKIFKIEIKKEEKSEDIIINKVKYYYINRLLLFIWIYNFYHFNLVFYRKSNDSERIENHVIQ